VADALLGALKYCDERERDSRAQAIAREAGGRIPRNLMLTSEELRSLRAMGIAVGAHTVSHPILARVPLADAEREISAGREHLQSLLDEQIDLFAYPNGKPEQDFTAAHARLVKSLGFAAAVTTAWGAASANSDMFQLPRFTPWDRSPLAFALRLLRYRFAPPPAPLQ
jgi:peptidoglycan/xylan/chitin deacetylase (PgdA/CDA1 family)